MATLVVWAATLYLLSSFSKTMPEGGPEIPHLDKILHFGFFLGGGVIFGTWILLRNTPSAPALVRIVIPLIIFALVGALDEYHQTFTPGRSGNDPFDWLADFLGGGTGLLLAHRFHHILLKFSSPVKETSKN